MKIPVDEIRKYQPPILWLLGDLPVDHFMVARLMPWTMLGRDVALMALMPTVTYFKVGEGVCWDNNQVMTKWKKEG